MDDGDVPTKCTMGQDYIYCPEYRGPTSLVKKLSHLVGNRLAKHEGLVFIEDDDFYAPTWLEFCANHLATYDLIGEGRAVYYNPVQRFWYEHGNMGHASLCSTAIKRKLFSVLFNACQSSNPFVDSRLWVDVQINKRVFDPRDNPDRKHLVIGMKGMPGRVGYGSGHVVRELAAQDDQDLSKLQELMGDDAKLYRKFGESKTVMTAQKQLIDSIHLGVNPYEGYPKEQWPVEHFGWGSTHPWFKMLIEKIKPRIIIEVGTLLGASAIHMAETVKAAGLDSAILCVDTFLAEQILWSIPEHRERLKIRFGRPCFYYTFLSNVIDKGCQDVIVPLCMPSQSAARHLTGLKIMAQMIYVDGCHEEGDCFRDLESYWDLLDAGGAMIIDDYEIGNPMFEGLIRDVDKFCKLKNVTRELDVNKALIWKK
jgi:hypothetical protein